MNELLTDMKWMAQQLALNPGDEAAQMSKIAYRALDELESYAEEMEPRMAVLDEELKPIMRCPRCRQILVYNAHFCWECGQAVMWK